MSAALDALQWVFLAYFVGVNLGYIALNLLAVPTLRRYLAIRPLEDLPPVYSGFEPPVSVLVPAYNEEATIVTSVRSLLQLDYPEFEVVVVNDGSRDATLERLREAFDLEPFPEAYWERIPGKPLGAVYVSRRHAGLRVVDKANGGKADALNVGINVSRYPLFCAIDADSILQRDSLRRVIQPFIDDPRTVATGGTVRIANGCVVSAGQLERVGLPSNPLALLQIVEYLRAFLFGRLGWATLNAVLIISGAFGVFRKDAVVAAGGYRTDTMGEDMELVVRLHRLYRERGEPYAIHFVPDPICWTEAPESAAVLRSQRVRWQRGLAESLSLNRALLLSPGGGAPGHAAYPFFLVFECWGPVIEVAGYAFMAALVVTGRISGEAFLAFLALAFSMGFLLSASALLLEEVSFHLYPRWSHVARLVAAAVVENLGYRQLVTVWRLVGLARWLRGARAQWGTMTRRGTWQGR
ncbi:MAG: glycosyltransferase family 2 protein [Betaproteobacteria bacterium]|nr:glycosyltransferase family 2 protein [Betaproteobacteria bacterium]PWB60530.1 MAG: glycosyl transferase [Betaproteobacteria bacterium]